MGVAVAWLGQIGMGAAEARNHLLAERGSVPGWVEIAAMSIVTSPSASRGSADDGRAARRRRRPIALASAAGLHLRVDDHVHDGHHSLRFSTRYFVSSASSPMAAGAG